MNDVGTFLKKNKVALIAGGSLLVIAYVMFGRSGSSSPISAIVGANATNNAAAYNYAGVNAQLNAQEVIAEDNANATAQIAGLQLVGAVIGSNNQLAEAKDASAASVANNAANTAAAVSINANRTAAEVAIAPQLAQIESATANLQSNNALSEIQNGQNNAFNLGLINAAGKLAPSLITGLGSLLGSSAGGVTLGAGADLATSFDPLSTAESAIAGFL